MKLTLAEIAARLDGTLEGDGSAAVHGLAGIREAEQGDITFLADPRYARALAETRATALIVDAAWQGACPCAVIRVKNADRAFTALAAMLAPPPPPCAPGVHPTAVVARDAALGAGASIGPLCVVESGARVGDRTALVAGVYLGHGVEVGCDCKLYPHVSVRERVKIGDRVIIHNGAVVGSDGFGYAHEGGAWVKIPQVGVVEIGDDVEIGANTTIDRARFGKTVIGRGVKIDNLVQVAHNVRIGEHTAIAAQVGIAGSSTIGRGVRVGGQAGVAGHLEVGDASVVGGQAGVTKDVPPGTFVSGFPAMPHDKAREMHAHVMRLPQLKERVAGIEKRLEEIERGRGSSSRKSGAGNSSMK
jgi:UDP-3-O-[3-hydroxymyristoyl] glucosamine N-acyltransferase